MIAGLSSLNRNRRAVAMVARVVVTAFRCIPAILWDRCEPAYRLNRRAEMVTEAAAMARAGVFRMWGWHAPRTVTALFREPERKVYRHDD